MTSPPRRSDELQELVERDFDLIERAEYPPLYDWAREATEDLPPERPAPPPNKPVFQYWNDQPDDQISTLFDMTAARCKEAALSWRRFDEGEAERFVAEAWGERHLAAFRRCAHQAQKSDFFRYMFLAENGGMWLDADLVLIEAPTSILAARRPLFYQRRSRHGLLTNWLIGSDAGDSILRELVSTVLHNIEAPDFDEQVRRGEISVAAGPRVVNRVVARRIHAHLRDRPGAPPPVRVIGDDVHDRFVRTGPAALGEPLAYKGTGRAWQRWREAKRRALER